MPLETVEYIEDLVPTNPVGATDPKSEGDDHIRNLKVSLLNQFPSLGREPVNLSAAQLNGFTGMICAFPAAITEGPATGWLRCNGQTQLRSAYPDLYAMIGVIYGPGNGVDDFVLPDYRGSFVRDQDDGAAVDPGAASRTDRGDGITGDAVGTKQASDNLSHDHTATVNVTDPGHSHTAAQAAHGHTATQPAHSHASTASSPAHSHGPGDQNITGTLQVSDDQGRRSSIIGLSGAFGAGAQGNGAGYSGTGGSQNIETVFNANAAWSGRTSVDPVAVDMVNPEATPAITVDPATPAITVDPIGTGITAAATIDAVGASESRPVNVYVRHYIHV